MDKVQRYILAFISVIALCLIFLLLKPDAETRDHSPVLHTAGVMNQLSVYIFDHYTDENQWPDNSGWATILQEHSYDNPLSDSWGRPINYYNYGNSAKLVSNGPSISSTNDDLVIYFTSDIDVTNNIPPKVKW